MCAMHAVTLDIPADHPAFQGHFPGNPLLPGVVLLAEVLEAVLRSPESAAAVGPRPRIGVAKFLAPVLPGARLSLELESKGASVRFDVRNGEQLCASGHFESVADRPTP